MHKFGNKAEGFGFLLIVHNSQQLENEGAMRRSEFIEASMMVIFDVVSNENKSLRKENRLRQVFHICMKVSGAKRNGCRVFSSSFRNITIIIDNDYLKTMPLYSHLSSNEYNDVKIMFAVIIKIVLMVEITVCYLDLNKFFFNETPYCRMYIEHNKWPRLTSFFSLLLLLTPRIDVTAFAASNAYKFR